MKYTLGAGVAVLALCVGGPAFAACPDDINKLRTDLQNNQSFQQRYTTGKIDRAGYMRLFEAAQTFATMGLEKRCQDVLAGIKEVSEKVEAEAPAAPPRTDQPRTTQPTPAPTDRREPRSTERTPPADARTDREDARVQRLRSAQPINTLSVSFENLVGSDVRNVRNDDLGDVEDIVVERGQISSVVIARGGFLGMGVNYHIIPASQVKIANLDDNPRDKKGRVLVLDLSDEQVKALARVKKENGQWVATESAPDRRATPPERAPSAPPSQPDTRPRQ